MYINTDSESFTAEDFRILNFYGKDTCFIWNNDEYVCFPYLYENNSTQTLKVLKAPKIIKDIRSFNERIFILCSPTGIYKLTDNFEFANLSKSGIELGADFCEVFTFSNEMLILENKKQKSIKKLFPISSTSNIHVLPLNYDSTDNILRKAFLSDNCDNRDNLCLISCDKKLFKMTSHSIQLIYNSNYLIKEIRPIERMKKVVGAVLKTDTNVVILIYIINSDLKYDKVFLEPNIQTVCAIMDSEIEHTLFIIYSNELKTYYIKKMLLDNSSQDIKIEENHYKSFRIYESKYIIYLNDSNELSQVNFNYLKDSYAQDISNYVKLDNKMLKGLDEIVETICKKSIELKCLREKLEEKEDMLKRINMFVSKDHLQYCSKDSVQRLLNQVFLICNFENVLPQNCIVVKMLKSRGKVTFSLKKVKKDNTIIQMPICISNLSAKLHTTTDLITEKNDEGVWCLIKNYFQDPFSSKISRIILTTNKINFVKHKLIVLQAMINENNLTMEGLVKIRNDVRKEMQEL